MPPLIEQVDHSRVRIGSFDHLPDHQIEGFFQAQSFIDPDTQIVETADPLYQFLRTLVQPSVFDSDGGLVGDGGEDFQVSLVIEVFLGITLNAYDPYHLAAGDHRYP